MANRKSRYDSISGLCFDVVVDNMATVSIVCQALGNKFRLIKYENGVATFEFQNR